MKSAEWFAWGRYLVDRLSWPGLLGAALILAAAAIQLGGVAPAQAGNRQLAADIERLRLQDSGRSDVVPAEDKRRLAALPSGDELTPLVAAVHSSARHRGVQLDQGEYVWQATPGNGRSGRYRMNFPARGTYPQLRGWVADVMSEFPALSLEAFDLRRENIGSESVEAQVRFVVLVGEAGI